MRPALQRRMGEAMKALTLSRSERTEGFKGTDFDTEDDVLRAIIRDCNWMVVCWQNEIQVAEYNQRLDENAERESLVANGPVANPPRL